MNKKYTKIISLIFAICLLVALIPFGLINNLNAATGDINTDGWEVDMELYDATGTPVKITDINWNSTATEKKTYQLVIKYKNETPEKTYAPGAIKFEFGSILENIRDVTDINASFDLGGGTPNAVKAEYFIDADKSTDAIKVNEWSYSLETTNKTYWNVPTKFILTNNKTLEAGTSFSGSINITFTMDSTLMKNNVNKTYDVIMSTTDGQKITLGSFNFNFTSTRRPYDIDIKTEKLKSIQGLPAGSENYIWVRYNLDYILDQTTGAREAFNKTLKVTVPSGAKVYDSTFTQLAPESGNTYSITTYKERINLDTFMEKKAPNTDQDIIIAFPQGTSTLDINALLYGTYRDETEEILLINKADSRITSEFVLDYEGSRFWIGKNSRTEVIPLEGVRNEGAIGQFELFYGARYVADDGAVHLICGDDVLFGQDANKNWYQLADSEYTFTEFDTTYAGNDERLGLRTLETGFDRAANYQVQIYLRYRNQSTYQLWQTGTFTEGSLGQKVTFPADVVGVQFKILNLDREDIELVGNLNIKFHSQTLAEDADIYNFSYLDAQYTSSNEMVKFNITDDNYVSSPSKTYLATYDRNTYGSLKFRYTDYLSILARQVLLTTEKTFDYSNISFDAATEKIKFNYLFHAFIRVDSNKDTTDSFKGFVLYDLLPYGVDIEQTPDQIRKKFCQNLWNVEWYQNASGTLTQDNMYEYYEKAITVSITRNYKNTGRTFLEIEFNFSEDPLNLKHTVNKLINDYGQGYYTDLPIKKDIPILCSISFDNWYQLGATYTNYLYSSNIDNNDDNDYSLVFNTIRMIDENPPDTIGSTSDNGTFEEILSDINENGNTGESIGYTKTITTIPVTLNTYMDIRKTISQNNKDFYTETINLKYDTEYYYKIRARIGVDNKAKDLIIYDSIEEISEGWKGTLQGFDTSFAESKGYKVKIYYSTTDQTNGSYNYPTDLSNSFWKEYVDGVDLSTIKHVAFRFMDTNGSPAIFESGTVMYVGMIMKSPNTTITNLETTTANELKTSNKSRLNIIPVDLVGNSQALIDLNSNTVSGLVPEFTISIKKLYDSTIADFEKMGINVYDKHRFNFTLTPESGGQPLSLYAEIQYTTPTTANVTTQKISGLKIGEYYTFNEILPTNSNFRLSKIDVNIDASGIEYDGTNGFKFKVTPEYSDKRDDTEKTNKAPVILITAKNSVVFKTIDLNITKLISGEDDAFTSNDLSRDDEFSFNVKLTNKEDPTDIKTGTVSNKTGLTISDIYPGTYILEETGVTSPWLLKAMAALNEVEGVSFALVGNNYELTVENTITNNAVYQIRIENELQKTGDPVITVVFSKVINGTTEAYENLNLDPNGEYQFQMNLINNNYRVHGIVTNKENLTIIQVPVGSYVVTESKDANFNFVDMIALNDVDNVTFEKIGNNYTLNVGDGVNGTEVLNIKVTNDLLPETFYASKDEQNNLFKQEREINYTNFTITDSNRAMIGYADETTNLVIPKTFKAQDGTYYKVTAIAESAFSDCTNLTSITIPDSITSIGTYAFSGCSNLLSATIPDSVIFFGNRVFFKCTGLTSVKIGNGVTSLDMWAFYLCSNLVSAELGSSVNSIDVATFGYSYNLKSITVNENNLSYTSVDGILFTKDMKTLVKYPVIKAGTHYTIPDSVTSIYSSAFNNCKNLKTITIPENITSIGTYAFSGCSNLTSIKIPNNITSIKEGVFSGCSNLTSIIIPNNVEFINDYAFNYCTGLISITIPEKVTYIGDSAFSQCTGLTSVTFENPTGWWYADTKEATEGTSIDSNDLTNTSIATTYLTNTYSFKYWKRS